MKLKIKNLKLKTLNLIIYISLINIFISCDENKDDASKNKFKYSVDSIGIISGDEGTLSAPVWEGGAIKEYEYAEPGVPSGLTLDSKTGSLKWEGKIIPGKYYIYIKNKNSNNILSLIFNVIFPRFKYLKKNYYGIRKKMDTTDTPKIIDGLKDGEFKINSTKNSDITIDKVTGKISWTDNLPNDLYTLFISNTNSRYLDTLYLDINYEIKTIEHNSLGLSEYNINTSLKVDDNGNIYIGDIKFKILNKNNELNFFTFDNTFNFNKFSNFRNFYISKKGNIFLSLKNKNIFKITPEGKVTKIDCCKNIDSEYTGPIITDSNENIYVIINYIKDVKFGYKSVIVRIDNDITKGDSIINFKSGSIDYLGSVDAMEFDKLGNIYCADLYGSRIYKITQDGLLTNYVGNGNGFKDGNISEAKFYHIYDIAFDSKNNLYVTDYKNSRIRKITPEGIVSTVVGKECYGNCNLDGNLSIAILTPVGIAIDKKDNIYITDDHTVDLIKKIIIE